MKPTLPLIEALESRIAPAGVTIINPHIATYTDSDGDHVFVKVSVGNLSDATFTFTPAGALAELELGGTFAGANISFTVIRAAHGDGLANVGFINASGVNLGSVSVKGDLGRIDAGDGGATIPAVSSLSVRSMGRLGLDSQQGVPSGSLESALNGSLGPLRVATDIDGADINVTGNIATVDIGGSLIGGSSSFSGAISTAGAGAIGAIKIGGDILGGGGTDSGVIIAGGNITGAITIGGSLTGGTVSNTGEITAAKMAAVTIGHDVQGGTGSSSGDIISSGAITALTIGGSVVGAAGNSSGMISAQETGPVKIGGELVGGSGANSGYVTVTDDIASISIGGSIVGGSNSAAGEIICASGNIGPVKIGGDILGGSGAGSGVLTTQTGNIGSVAIGGSILGGATAGTGELMSKGTLGFVTIGHDLEGGLATGSGAIECSGNLAGITLGGSLIGGATTGAQAGFIKSDTGNIGNVTIGGSVIGGAGQGDGAINSGGSLGFVKVGHNIVGNGEDSGEIFAGGSIGGARIGGSLIGAFNTNMDNGLVESESGNIGPVKIGQNVQGGEGEESGSVLTMGGNIASVAIGGAILGGTAEESGIVNADGTLGAVTVGRSVVGNGPASGFIGSQGNLASVTIGGSLIGGPGGECGEIITSTDGSIGPVKIAGNIAGGSITGTAGPSGNSGLILSARSISSVQIGGSIISGTDTSTTVHATLEADGAIQAALDIGSITVGGSLIGNPDGGTGNAASPVVISAGGLAAPGGSTDTGIGSITVAGRVEDTVILAGYLPNLAPMNLNARIGAVKVGGDWIASDLVAGATNTDVSGAPFPDFGNASDARIIGGSASILSRIAGITIGGQLFGTPDSVSSTDNYGFVAEAIGAVRIGGIAITVPTDQTPMGIGETDDVDIHIIS